MELKTTPAISFASSTSLFFLLSTIFLQIELCKSQLSLPVDLDVYGAAGRSKTYIIQVVNPRGNTDLLGDEDLAAWHRSFLPNTTLSSGEPRLVYSYRHSLSGFAARLTPEELREVQAMDGFVLARPDQKLKLATTYTPSYLGLSQMNGSWSRTFYGQGIIIGVIDSGIIPTHPSFSDAMMAPPPVRWKGKCEFTGFTCNNKIIGGVGFEEGNRTSPEDHEGHGTHVAGIAAGSFVDNANVLGMAAGTASGMAPRAHLAIYKACWDDGCRASNVFAAVDQALRDGVDIITMSIGSSPEWNYTSNVVVLSSLAAVKKGVFVSSNAGNQGPDGKSLDHDAPWVMVAGATANDRRIQAVVKLGDGTELEGESAFQPESWSNSDNDTYPLVYPGSAGSLNATFCLNGSLDHINVRGKVVVCVTGLISDDEKGKVVYAAGGTAMIIVDQFVQGNLTYSTPHVIPAANVNYLDGLRTTAYLNSDPSPTATIIFGGTVFGARPSTAVASFSSRGPGEYNGGGILKPDVLAPGVNILSAWPFQVGPPQPSADFGSSTFNFKSGTSMAAPHVAGIVALIKSKYPGWSAAAITSAIITSARDADREGNPIADQSKPRDAADIFATGAGEVFPDGALDPGLVYDTKFSDYIGFVCGLGYSDKEVTAMAGESVECNKVETINSVDLNYPSILVKMNSTTGWQSIERTAKNVGPRAIEVYRANITEPEGVRVDLSAYELSFSRVEQEMSFTVRLKAEGSNGGAANSRGKIAWISDHHVVTTPIAVLW